MSETTGTAEKTKKAETENTIKRTTVAILFLRLLPGGTFHNGPINPNSSSIVTYATKNFKRFMIPSSKVSPLISVVRSVGQIDSWLIALKLPLSMSQTVMPVCKQYSVSLSCCLRLCQNNLHSLHH